MYNRNVALTVLLITVLTTSLETAQAQDWGYDQKPVEKEIVPMKAVALPLKPGASTPAKPKAGAAAPAVASHVAPTAPRTMPSGHAAPKAVASPSATAVKLDYATECWSQLYQVASGKKLGDGEKKRLADVVKKAPNRQQVTVFWPRVTEYLLAHTDQKENYVRLLRALLRWRARALSATTDSATPPAFVTEERNLINELLGPERVAVEGSPAFSEESVEAYADMACFLYEQNHPGKSIDAFDNRAMFASRVCENFRNAPTDKDKRAMCAFDLVWAKFRVAWDAASESKRAEMLTILQETGAAKAGMSSQDPVLKSVLDNWKI